MPSSHIGFISYRCQISRYSPSPISQQQSINRGIQKPNKNSARLCAFSAPVLKPAIVKGVLLLRRFCDTGPFPADPGDVSELVQCGSPFHGVPSKLLVEPSAGFHKMSGHLNKNWEVVGRTTIATDNHGYEFVALPTLYGNYLFVKCATCHWPKDEITSLT